MLIFKFIMVFAFWIWYHEFGVNMWAALSSDIYCINGIIINIITNINLISITNINTIMNIITIISIHAINNFVTIIQIKTIINIYCSTRKFGLFFFFHSFLSYSILFEFLTFRVSCLIHRLTFYLHFFHLFFLPYFFPY